MSWNYTTDPNKDLACNLREMRKVLAHLDLLGQWFYLAHYVVGNTFTIKWYQEEVLRKSQLEKNFFYFGKDENEKFNFKELMITFAHMLFILRNSVGYKAFISKMERNLIGDIYYELNVAFLLFENGYEIEFVVASGHKTADFDLISRKKGDRINVEVKSRKPVFGCSVNGIFNILRGAQSQLPRTDPGVIFLRLPPEFVEDINNRHIVEIAVELFFTHTERISSVIVFWPVWEYLQTGRVNGVGIHQFDNPNSQFLIDTLVIRPNTLQDGSNPLTSFKPSFFIE